MFLFIYLAATGTLPLMYTLFTGTLPMMYTLFTGTANPLFQNGEFKQKKKGPKPSWALKYFIHYSWKFEKMLGQDKNQELLSPDN